ncbi:MAG: protease, partial [Congregibacter sp.]|nr:protease [Congregibacter sp.]
MGAFLKFATWPAIAGLLGALLILEHWVWSPANSGRDAVVRDSFRQAVAAATPSVVNIYTEKRVASGGNRMLNNPLMPIPSGVPRQRVESSLGSGVIMRKDGYILT